VVRVGLAAWSLETEYGSGSNWATESSGGTTRLYAVDEQNPDAEGHPGTSLVLEGTQQEVDAYIANYEAEGRNYLVSGLLIGVGGLLLVSAVLPFRRREENESQ